MTEVKAGLIVHANAAQESAVPTSESLLPVLNALLRCHTQVERVCTRDIERMGLTPAQFDVLAVLGDTPGMTCKALGEEALITRGTLIPVLDRLEAKGLVKRSRGTCDSRQTIVALTPEGQAMFEATFYKHVDFVRPLLDKLDPAEQADLIRLLGKLKSAFFLAPT